MLILALSHLIVYRWLAGRMDTRVLYLETSVGLPLLQLFVAYHDVPWMPDTLPQVIRQLIGMILTYEGLFYYSHRLLHSRWLKRFHQWHHTYQDPDPVMALFGHPIELVINLIGPALLVPYLFRASWVLTWLWICAGTAKVVRAHTPRMTNHHWHHVYGNVNYGVLDLLDIIHGTYQEKEE